MENDFGATVFLYPLDYPFHEASTFDHVTISNPINPSKDGWYQKDGKRIYSDDGLDLTGLV